MRYLKNTDLRFHLVEKRARWFIWLAVLAFLAIGAFVIWKQEYLRPTKEIQLEAGGSQGIKRGLAVRLSGFRIGKVSDVELVAEGRVRVGVDLFREYSRFVRKDSVATLTSESLIGDRFIEISGGSAKEPEIGEHESLELQPEKSLSTMMESLRDEIRPAVIDMRDMIAYMNAPDGDLKVTMRNVRAVADAMGKDLPPWRRRATPRSRAPACSRISMTSGAICAARSRGFSISSTTPSATFPCSSRSCATPRPPLRAPPSPCAW
jgi:phospholipid/cholesterol/gamma-HCH transport system substrate-binding protein